MKKLIIFLLTLTLLSVFPLVASKKIVYADAVITIKGSENGIIPGNNYPIEITGLTPKDVLDITNSGNSLYLYTYDKNGKVVGEPIFIQPKSDGTVNSIPQYNVPAGTAEGQLSFILSATPKNQIDNINKSKMTLEQKKSAIETAGAANIYGSTTEEFTSPMAQQVEKIQKETNNENLPGWLNNPVTSKNPIVDKNNGKATTTTETPDLAAKVNTIVNYSTGIGGIIAFLLIVFGGFQIILSAGNPERVKAGKEMITSAIAGLLLIIFAVFILRLIGYDILKIPGFQP